ncbi:unnamed protein product [Fraxinus pennsylvanica]|uniref:Reverse transcriptase Ty1/copia-type domain-containing protein n=1 Tax=Fraxinus pennsylvanica TaxID=56036 RepID=A0AAD1ZNW2_9LAMI|nr:unnamed protein product [Fraxinus pennsylvanica]
MSETIVLYFHLSTELNKTLSISSLADVTHSKAAHVEHHSSSDLNDNQYDNVLHGDDLCESEGNAKTELAVPKPDVLRNEEIYQQSDENEIEERLQQRARNPVEHPMITRGKAGVFKPKVYLGNSTGNISEPKNVTEAMMNDDWKKAMGEEFNALTKTETWELVPPSPTYNIVVNKWIFKLKYNTDGSVQRFKARLVAKGFHQTPGIDFYETFSLVIKPSTLRIILTLAVAKDWTIR